MQQDTQLVEKYVILITV